MRFIYEKLIRCKILIICVIYSNFFIINWAFAQTRSRFNKCTWVMQYLDEDRPIWSKYQVHKNLQLLRWLIMSMTHCIGSLHIFWVMIMQKWLSLRSSDRAWSMYVRHNCELHCCASLLFASLLCVRFTVVAWGGACSLARPWAAVAPWPVVLCMCCTAGFVTQTSEIFNPVVMRSSCYGPWSLHVLHWSIGALN